MKISSTCRAVRQQDMYWRGLDKQVWMYTSLQCTLSTMAFLTHQICPSMIYLTGKCVENGPMYIFSMNICRPHVLFRLVGRKSPQPRVWTTKQKCGAQRLKSNYHSTPKPPTQIRLLQELIHCGHARSSARTMVTRWASIWAQSRSWSIGHGMGWAYICDQSRSWLPSPSLEKRTTVSSSSSMSSCLYDLRDDTWKFK